MPRNSKNGGVVYSTEFGRTCPECSQPIAECRCHDEVVPESDGYARISLDKKGRKGKDMTLVSGIALPEKELKKLAKELKQKCGVGGAVKEHIIEIQGDQRDLLIKLLEEKGYKTKRVGG